MKSNRLQALKDAKEFIAQHLRGDIDVSEEQVEAAEEEIRILEAELYNEVQ